ncbi:hypothetical protein COW81_02110 [Candidatus Campbellbacteria bacterium CG22_combo_CG10-13_8_21_14_all_36_13]|uniref:DoxX family protein n=1 Tax=Candidatus Campbellbacteria bacterium CG22_combo_CG10-13_8_21_14_all_36_13 TaxID=1974529 RepID=A0A2H0DY58_9BACT|nr:MAG: hypothetical protein COW81_02110 [Candidatus Campbellbacteria bacterium CG22_combo_CG10-13_8_21_14_all_36_13]
MSRTQIGLTILRFGLSAVFLWFGFSQLLDGINWVYLVPDWAVNTLQLPPAMLVLANGLVEVVLGALLAMGIWTRIVALLLGLHLALISFSLGISPSGVRDFGLVLATFSLAIIGDGKTEDI